MWVPPPPFTVTKLLWVTSVVTLAEETPMEFRTTSLFIAVKYVDRGAPNYASQGMNISAACFRSSRTL